MSSSHLRLDLPSYLFPSGFPIKILYVPLLLSPTLAACPAHPILLDLTAQIVFGEEQRTLCSSLRSFLQSPVILPHLGPNILLSNLFSNSLSLCSSLNVSDQVPRPYKTTDKVTVLYIVIFILFDSKLEDKEVSIEW